MRIIRLGFYTSPMDVVVTLLLIPTVLKAVGTLNAIRWLTHNGLSYRRQLDERSPLSTARFSQADYFQLLRDRPDAHFFPFGQKDFRLRAFIHERHSKTDGKLARGALAALYGTVYRLHRLTLVSTVYVILSGVLLFTGSGMWLLETRSAAWLLFSLSACLLVCALIQAVESIYSHAILGGYAAPFHMHRAEATSLLAEVKVLAGCVANTLLAATGAVFVCAVNLQGFSGFPGTNVRGGSAMIDRVVDSIYFVSTTLFTVGFGDITPSSLLARIVVIDIEASGFALLVLGVAALSTGFRRNV
jgi:hypothetical protein